MDDPMARLAVGAGTVADTVLAVASSLSLTQFSLRDARPGILPVVLILVGSAASADLSLIQLPLADARPGTEGKAAVLTSRRVAGGVGNKPGEVELSSEAGVRKGRLQAAGGDGVGTKPCEIGFSGGGAIADSAMCTAGSQTRTKEKETGGTRTDANRKEREQMRTEGTRTDADLQRFPPGRWTSASATRRDGELAREQKSKEAEDSPRLRRVEDGDGWDQGSGRWAFVRIIYR